MADVTNELLLGILKNMQTDMAKQRESMEDMRTELQAIRGHQLATQSDDSAIYSRLTSIETRIERIENPGGTPEKRVVYPARNPAFD